MTESTLASRSPGQANAAFQGSEGRALGQENPERAPVSTRGPAEPGRASTSRVRSGRAPGETLRPPRTILCTSAGPVTLLPVVGESVGPGRMRFVLHLPKFSGRQGRDAESEACRRRCGPPRRAPPCPARYRKPSISGSCAPKLRLGGHQEGGENHRKTGSRSPSCRGSPRKLGVADRALVEDESAHGLGQLEIGDGRCEASLGEKEDRARSISSSFISWSWRVTGLRIGPASRQRWGRQVVEKGPQSGARLRRRSRSPLRRPPANGGFLRKVDQCGLFPIRVVPRKTGGCG